MTASGGASGRCEPRELRAGLGFVIGDVDPLAATNAGGLAVVSHVHEPLLRRDVVTGALLPGVLERRAQYRGDGRYELHVDRSARFHDGAPVTAADVAATLTALLQSAPSSGPVADGLDGVWEASAVDDETLTVRTEGVLPRLDERLAMVRVLPASAAFLAPGRARAAVGAGPYVVAELDGSEARLEPAPSYRPRGGHDRRQPLRLLGRPSAPEREELLLGGALDVIEDPSPDFLARLPARPDLLAAWVPGLNMTWLMFNCSAAPFDDVRARRAVALAVDRHALSQRVHGGRLEPASGFLPRWHAEFAGGDASAGFAPARARELLQAAGAVGARVELLVSSASWVERQAGLVGEQLTALGLDVTARVVHTAEVFADEIPRGAFQVLLASGDPSVFASDAEFVLRWYLAGRWARRYTHLPEPDVVATEAVLARLVREARPEQRRVLLRALRDRAEQLCSMTVIGHRPQPTAWSADLVDFRPSSTTGLDLRHAFTR